MTTTEIIQCWANSEDDSIARVGEDTPGAKRRHIVMQFLIEAMTLSLAGGVLGIVLGVTGAKLTTLIAGWPTIISGNVILLAFFFSLIVGLFFGLYPASKASRLNPIDALRYE